MKQSLVILVLLSLLAATALVSWWVWRELAGVEIGMHGWIALSLGVGATLALGILLVTLMHQSAKRGFDDEAGKD